MNDAVFYEALLRERIRLNENQPSLKRLKPFAIGLRLYLQTLGNREFVIMVNTGQIGEIQLLELVETETEDRPYASYLEERGFRIDCRQDLSLAIRLLNDENYSGLILNLSNSGGSGLDVLRQIRSVFLQPIFVFASQFESIDRIVAYEMGADDFLTNDLSLRELVTRVRAGIRRCSSGVPNPEAVLLVQDLQLSPNARTVFRDGVCINLTPIEFDMLAALMRRPGTVCTREMLLEATDQDPYAVLDRTADVHIAALRRKLQDSARSPKYIRTVRGIGYSLREFSLGQ